jgi:hypothetical protein
MPKTEELTIPSMLANSESLANTPELAETAAKIFEYTQFLLDDDENLTRTGNLTGEAKRQLRERAFELLAIDMEPSGSDDSEEETP